MGSDLKTLNLGNFEDCKTSCSEYRECSFFTINKNKCNLKGKNVEIRKKTGVVSGATNEICSMFNFSKKNVFFFIFDFSLLSEWLNVIIFEYLKPNLEQFSSKYKIGLQQKIKQSTSILSTALQVFLFSIKQLSTVCANIRHNKYLP